MSAADQFVDPTFDAIVAQYAREDAAQQARIDKQFVRRPVDRQDSAMAVAWGLDTPLKPLSDSELDQWERERRRR